jgi:hypothetical protein
VAPLSLVKQKLTCRRLSDELYSKPTRFILELIQNTDGNRYDYGVPKLTIIYRKGGFLWIGCNENGFKPEDVQALCRIGGSTKKNLGSRRGYIGEKGIGFKSVFKVADKGLGIFKTVSILFQQTETSWNGYAGVDRI